MANTLKIDCSIKPVGDRGCVVPSTRKNPRFPAGTQFTIKVTSINGLLIKFGSHNSLFTILAADAPMVLGMTLPDFNAEVKAKQAEGMKYLIKAGAELLAEAKRIS
jgi:hypothetical protein